MKRVSGKCLRDDPRHRLSPFPNHRHLRVWRVTEQLLDLAKEKRAARAIRERRPVLTKQLLHEVQHLLLAGGSASIRSGCQGKSPPSAVVGRSGKPGQDPPAL